MVANGGDEWKLSGSRQREKGDSCGGDRETECVLRSKERVGREREREERGRRGRKL